MNEPTVVGIPIQGFLALLASIGVIAIVAFYVAKQGKTVIAFIKKFIKKLV